MPDSVEKEVPFLAVRGLRTYFHAEGGFVRAVDGVSFAVAPRARVGLAGASGSGKTQTALSVLGLLDDAPGIVGGSVWIDGQNVLKDLKQDCTWDERDGRLVIEKAVARWRARHERRLRPIRGRQISMVFQEPLTALVPYQTVAAHLRETHAARTDGEHFDAEAWLHRLGFETPARVLPRYPHELSGGECQRVMLGLALLGQPRLLIADEPTTLLDALSRRRTLDLLTALLDERDDLALLLISHDLALLRLLVDEVVLLFAGTVVERGPVAAVLDPATTGHPYTQALLGATPGATAPAGIPHHAGCRYFHRCALKEAFPAAFRRRCRHEPPPEVPVGAAHRVACWAHEEAT